MDSGKFYSGTSGLVLPVKNKTEFPAVYQNKSRLNYYSSLFNSIEINSSFYKVPLACTVEKWADDTGRDFRFTFKLWRNITHNKDLAFDPCNVQKFRDVIERADGKKGCLLIQFPASTKANNIHKLEHLLTEINHLQPTLRWKLAIEFRDRSWYNDETYTLLEKQNSCMVIHDMPKSATPLTTGINSDFIYLRFHGPGGKYGGSYDDDFLQDYAGLIKEWLQDGKNVYAYFNNTMGDAIKNLMTLNKYVNGQN